MRRSFVKLATVCASAALLSGCLALGDVDRRATSFDQGVGSFENRSVLLNLARASLREPMYFVSIGSTQASGTEDLHASVPSFGEGPNLTATTRAFTFSPGGTVFLDNQTQTNAQMNVFSTHDFYQGMMEPLTVEEINLLLRQGYPRELVFYLTIARAKITPLDKGTFKPYLDADADPTHHPYYIYNDPNSAKYAEFAGHIELAMEAGLSTDVAADAKPDAAGSTDKEIAYAPLPAGATAGGVQFVLKEDTKAGPKVVECLDEALQSDNGRKFVAGLENASQPVHICGATAAAGTQENVVFWPTGPGPNDFQPQKVEIIFRSTYEIFRYLGDLMNDQGSAATACAQPANLIPELLRNPNQLQNPSAPPFICDYTAPNTPVPVGPLFRVVTQGDAGSCFTAVTYANRRYCVPNGGPELDATKDVFNILVSLIALKQSPGDLPTPAAVVLQ